MDVTRVFDLKATFENTGTFLDGETFPGTLAIERGYAGVVITGPGGAGNPTPPPPAARPAAAPIPGRQAILAPGRGGFARALCGLPRWTKAPPPRRVNRDKEDRHE